MHMNDKTNPQQFASKGFVGIGGGDATVAVLNDRK